jgi:magnesium transporter
LLESIQNIISDEPAQISKSNIKYINDIKDHVQYNFELVETFKENQRAMLELNQSNQSNNMTQVMKTLTIVTSIFIPLTFIVGVYGMNFHYMPEIDWKWGYFTVMFFMLIIAISMIFYMKRKKWF